MKKKRLLGLFLAVTVTASMVGCGSSGSKEAENTADSAGAQQADASNEGGTEYNLKMASAASADMYPNVAMQKACDEVYEKTNGKVKITLYADNLLGDYSTCFEDIMKGSLDMSMFSLPTSYDERLGIVSMPYMITDWDQYSKVCYEGGALYERIEELLAENNVKPELFTEQYLNW